jgi:hypothetical protein
VLNGDGTLSLPVDLPQSSELRASAAANVTYPSVAQLRAGAARRQRLLVTLELTNAREQRTVVSELKPGQHSLQLAFEVQAEAAPPISNVTTPAGTFDNPLGVRLAFGTATLINARPKFANGLVNLFSSFGAALTSDYYFARGRGLTFAVLPGGVQLELRSCSG